MTDLKEPLPDSSLGKNFLTKYQQALNEIHKEVIELSDVIENIFIAMRTLPRVCNWFAETKLSGP